VSLSHLLHVAASSFVVDARHIDPAVEDQLVEHIRGLDNDLRASFVEQMMLSPGFVGSNLFARVVSFAGDDVRRRMWATGQAAVEQVRSALESEPSPAVRAAMVVHYDLGHDVTEHEAAHNDDFLGGEMWAELIDIARNPETARQQVPLSIWVRVAASDPQFVALYEQQLLEQLVGTWPELAVAVATSPDVPASLRLHALVHPDVPAQMVVEVVTGMTGEAPTGRASSGAVSRLLDTRPIMTAAEVDAVAQLAQAWSISSFITEELDRRRDWGLSDQEFVQRAQDAQSTEELLAVVEQVPDGMWEEMSLEMVTAVVSSPRATLPVMQAIIRAEATAAWPGDPVSLWHPTADVFDDQQLLCRLLRHATGADPADGTLFKSVRSEWRDVLAGPRAEEFTRAAIENPNSVHPLLWSCQMPWRGDIDALAMLVPAGAVTSLGSPALMAAVLNTALRADPTGAAAGLLGTFGAWAQDKTVGDVLAAYDAATV
jgi:hypothetical protein